MDQEKKCHCLMQVRACKIYLVEVQGKVSVSSASISPYEKKKKNVCALNWKIRVHT